MAEWMIFVAVATVSCAIGFGPLLFDWAEGIVYRVRYRRGYRELTAKVNNLKGRVDHQKVLARIDELERELEVGKYSPVAKELDARMAAEESTRVAEELRAKKAEEMAKRAKQHAELVEKLRSRGEDFPVSEANRILGWFSNGRLDPTARPVRRVVNEKTGEVIEIRAFGT